MASGDTLCVFVPNDNEPPSSGYATRDTRNGHPVLDFDPSSRESAIFTAVLPRHYAGGGITARLIWCSTATGDVVFDTSIERLEDGGTDIDADSYATANTVTAAAPATSGVLKYTDIAHTSGAQMDSLAAGEAFRFKIERDTTDAADTMAADAELLAVELRET
jgi:hypothetical protein